MTFLSSGVSNVLQLDCHCGHSVFRYISSLTLLLRWTFVIYFVA